MVSVIEEISQIKILGGGEVKMTAPKIVKIDWDLFIFCNECNYKIREYDLHPCWPNVENINKKAIESPKDLYPNYCENCGVRLK